MLAGDPRKSFRRGLFLGLTTAEISLLLVFVILLLLTLEKTPGKHPEEEPGPADEEAGERRTGIPGVEGPPAADATRAELQREWTALRRRAERALDAERARAERTLRRNAAAAQERLEAARRLNRHWRTLSRNREREAAELSGRLARAEAALEEARRGNAGGTAAEEEGERADLEQRLNLAEELGKIRAELENTEEELGRANEELRRSTALLEEATGLRDAAAAAVRRAEEAGRAAGAERDAALADRNAAREEARAAKAELARLTARKRAGEDGPGRGGRGTEHPSCWTNEDGSSAYLFNIALLDAGYRIEDTAVEAPWRGTARRLLPLAGVRRGRTLTPAEFAADTGAVFDWSVERKNLFQVREAFAERHFYKFRDGYGYGVE